MERFHPRLYVACSFQKEASVIMDMLLRIEPEARFFTLDTGVLFDETYATWRRSRSTTASASTATRACRSTSRPSGTARRCGTATPTAAAAIRKVVPLDEALSDVDAWVSGLRRDQSAGRANTPKLDWDRKHGLWKLNPLADWTERDVWRYIVGNDVPYNPLHDRGYSSIGCTHCTHPGGARAGRWAGTDKIECGIHAG